MKYLFFILLTSCSSSIIAPVEYRRIYFEQYIENIQDCSNKASELLDVLTEKGHKAEIWICKTNVQNVKHAVVYCNGIILDPTNGKYYDKEWQVYIFKSNLYIKSVSWKELQQLKISNPWEWEWDY